MSERSSRALTAAAAVLAAILVLYGLVLTLDPSPVGIDGSADCGNSFSAGRDGGTAATLCGMHDAIGLWIGIPAVAFGLLVFGGDTWRRSRRKQRAAPVLSNVG